MGQQIGNWFALLLVLAIIAVVLTKKNTPSVFKATFGGVAQDITAAQKG